MAIDDRCDNTATRRGTRDSVAGRTCRGGRLRDEARGYPGEACQPEYDDTAAHACPPGARQPAVLRLCRPRSLQMPVCGDLDAVPTSASEELRKRPVDCSRAATERPRLGPLGTLALLGFAT